LGSIDDPSVLGARVVMPAESHAVGIRRGYIDLPRSGAAAPIC
jgi:hypothetical protein